MIMHDMCIIWAVDNVHLLNNEDWSRRNSKFDNSFTYSDYNGYLLVEEVDFDDNSDSRIVNEVEIIGRYFPWPKYYAGDKP